MGEIDHITVITMSYLEEIGREYLAKEQYRVNLYADSNTIENFLMTCDQINKIKYIPSNEYEDLYEPIYITSDGVSIYFVKVRDGLKMACVGFRKKRRGE